MTRILCYDQMRVAQRYDRQNIDTCNIQRKVTFGITQRGYDSQNIDTCIQRKVTFGITQRVILRKGDIWEYTG